MYFRFGSVMVLVVLVAMAGVALEKNTLDLRRAVSRQYYRTEVLLERHAALRLRTQRLASPVRVIEAMERQQMTPTGLAKPDAVAPARDTPHEPVADNDRQAAVNANRVRGKRPDGYRSAADAMSVEPSVTPVAPLLRWQRTVDLER